MTLALLAAATARGEALDSLALLVQRGDSMMQQYNTYEALKYYQQAYDLAQAQGVTRFSMDADFSMSKPYVPEDRIPRQIRLKLADCQYKRANYRQTAELLKNMPDILWMARLWPDSRWPMPEAISRRMASSVH